MAHNNACLIVEALHVEVREVCIRALSSNEVLVKVEVTGLCGSDLHMYEHAAAGARALTTPVVMGHESAGTVVKVGGAVTAVAIGDRVAIEPVSYCRRCFNCKRGQTNLCRYYKLASLPPTDGTLCQYFVCDEDLAIKIPDNVSWIEASCIQPLAVAIHMARKARFAPGKTVAIFGCGPLGCLLIATAKACGVSQIIAFDRHQSRVDFAKSIGADFSAIPPPISENEELTEWANNFKSKALAEAGIDPWGVDICVEATGSEACIHAGVAFLQSGGTFVQAGFGPAITTFPILSVATREIEVLGSARYGPGCFEVAVDFLSRGLVNVKPMITAVYPLTKAKEALEAVRRKEDIKVVILNQS